MSIERRRDVRVDVRVPAGVLRTTGFEEVEVADVSLRGLFVRMRRAPAMNELLRFRMSLPSGNIELHAVTVRTVRDRLGRNGVGLRLFAMNGVELSAWQEFVSVALRERSSFKRAA